MTDFVELPSGLVVPASHAQGVGEQAGGEPTETVKPKGGWRPSVPPGFQKDLDAYYARTGKKLRAHFNEKYEVWNIQAQMSDGQWTNILVVLDWDQRSEENPWPYRPLDQRVFVDIYAADLAHRFNTGDPDTDLALYHLATIEARRIAEERIQSGRDQLFADIEQDAKKVNARIAEYMRGDAADLKVVHQVPAGESA